jgi:class 3 adenylate cyclase
MNCPGCGSANEAGRKFCGECGERLASICPSCGSSNAPGARFCGECGTPLVTGTAPAGAASATGSTPASGASSATGSAPAAAPVAERRLVSILFVDLVGFTTLSEGRDPEEVRELLTRYFDVARDMVERYGGTIEKFIGDAVMAVWGAPTAHEDDAERAVRAALDVVDAVRGLGPGLEARAGVLTGEAAVTIGARGQGMVAGDLVNTASRLQSVAPSGVVLVGEATHRATSGAIAYEEAGDQLLKGKAAPVPAWRAMRVVAQRRGVGRGDRLEAPFVGRDSELRLLKDLFHATAREKRLRLVSVTGQGGIGKSRLAWEFEKYVDGIVERVLWHEGRSPAYGEGVTFWALGEMVRSRAGLLESDDEPTTRAKVHDMVEQHVEPADRERVERALLALLGVAEAPPGGAEELFGAWRTFFEQMAHGALVALLFEDLHWADQGTLDFIDHVLEWSRNVPILIITLARPELLAERPGWGAGKRNFLALDLQPLDDEAMRSLLAAFVPNLPVAAVRSIIGRADGIPLYAVETVRMLIADGRLVERPGGGFDPVGELGELSVPETLQALIAARLDGLDPVGRSLIQDAAVLGQSFAPAGLAAISGMDLDEVRTRLHGLAQADLLRELVDPRSPERGQFAFVQALIREVAYGTLAMRDRRSRHLAAARYFESLGDEEIAGALAAHYLAAFRSSPAGPEADALAAQARISLRAAADRATALGATKQALTFLGESLEVTTDEQDRLETLAAATQAALNAFDNDRALAFGAQFEELAEKLGDRPMLAKAFRLISSAYYSNRRREDAMTYVEARLARFDDIPDEPEVVRLLASHASGLSMMGEYDRGRAAADRALAAAERLGLADVAVRMLLAKGQVAFYQGRQWEGVALTDGARRLAEQRDLKAELLSASSTLTSMIALDDPRATADTERQIVEMARRVGRRESEIVMLGNMAEDVLRTGDWDPIVRELEAASDDVNEVDDLLRRASLSLFYLYRGEMTPDELAAMKARLETLGDRDVAASRHDLDGVAAFVDGRFADAARSWIANADASDLNAPYALPKAGRAAARAGEVELAETTLSRLAALGTRGRAIETDMVAIRAGVAALKGDRTAALAGYREARQSFRDLGLRWDEALLGMSAGTRLGMDDAEVRGWVTEAATILRQLRARPLMDQADRLLDGAPRSAAAPPTQPAGPASDTSEVRRTS